MRGLGGLDGSREVRPTRLGVIGLIELLGLGDNLVQVDSLTQGKTSLGVVEPGGRSSNLLGGAILERRSGLIKGGLISVVRVLGIQLTVGLLKLSAGGLELAGVDQLALGVLERSLGGLELSRRGLSVGDQALKRAQRIAIGSGAVGCVLIGGSVGIAIQQLGVGQSDLGTLQSTLVVDQGILLGHNRGKQSLALGLSELIGVGKSLLGLGIGVCICLIAHNGVLSIIVRDLLGKSLARILLDTGGVCRPQSGGHGIDRRLRGLGVGERLLCSGESLLEGVGGRLGPTAHILTAKFIDSSLERRGVSRIGVIDQEELGNLGSRTVPSDRDVLHGREGGAGGTGKRAKAELAHGLVERAQLDIRRLAVGSIGVDRSGYLGIGRSAGRNDTNARVHLATLGNGLGNVIHQSALVVLRLPSGLGVTIGKVGRGLALHLGARGVKVGIAVGAHVLAAVDADLTDLDPALRIGRGKADAQVATGHVELLGTVGIALIGSGDIGLGVSRVHVARVLGVMREPGCGLGGVAVERVGDLSVGAIDLENLGPLAIGSVRAVGDLDNTLADEIVGGLGDVVGNRIDCALLAQVEHDCVALGGTLGVLEGGGKVAVKDLRSVKVAQVALYIRGSLDRLVARGEIGKRHVAGSGCLDTHKASLDRLLSVGIVKPLERVLRVHDLGALRERHMVGVDSNIVAHGTQVNRQVVTGLKRDGAVRKLNAAVLGRGLKAHTGDVGTDGAGAGFLALGGCDLADLPPELRVCSRAHADAANLDILEVELLLKI